MTFSFRSSSQTVRPATRRCEWATLSNRQLCTNETGHVTPLRRKIMSIREYLLNGPLGFGAAPLGNMFRNIPDEEAEATVDAAWQQGTRYYDTAPFYGAGLSEVRLGKVLAKHKRDEYRLSTEVGRLILDEIDHEIRNFGEKGDLFPLLIHQPSYSMLNRHIET